MARKRSISRSLRWVQLILAGSEPPTFSTADRWLTTGWLVGLIRRRGFCGLEFTIVHDWVAQLAGIIMLNEPNRLYID